MGIIMTKKELITRSYVLRTRGLLKRAKTQYKYVKSYTYEGVEVFYAQISAIRWSKMFKNLKEAAIAVDTKLLEIGKKPVNVLKPKLKDKV
jgi:hypothetical protein